MGYTRMYCTAEGNRRRRGRREREGGRKLGGKGEEEEEEAEGKKGRGRGGRGGRRGWRETATCVCMASFSFSSSWLRRSWLVVSLSVSLCSSTSRCSDRWRAPDCGR